MYISICGYLKNIFSLSGRSEKVYNVFEIKTLGLVAVLGERKDDSISNVIRENTMDYRSHCKNMVHGK